MINGGGAVKLEGKCIGTRDVLVLPEPVGRKTIMLRVESTIFSTSSTWYDRGRAPCHSLRVETLDLKDNNGKHRLVKTGRRRGGENGHRDVRVCVAGAQGFERAFERHLRSVRALELFSGRKSSIYDLRSVRMRVGRNRTPPDRPHGTDF